MENKTARTTEQPKLDLAPLGAMVTRTEPYALKVVGDALSPRHPDGSIVIVDPCFAADPSTIEPGTVVVVALADDDNRNRFRRVGLWVKNGDGDLVAGDGFRPAGTYIIIGRVRD